MTSQFPFAKENLQPYSKWYLRYLCGRFTSGNGKEIRLMEIKIMMIPIETF
uniref:Uncharacterized protein n=1 Tax=Anguilla anguilla TaxID=7936 RepID=A0A0E9XG47_ANGAN